MDQFQIKFWKSRQAEWEPYTFQYAPLKIEQGKLTDPLYFDFISYVQFQTVAREIPAGVSFVVPSRPFFPFAPALPHTATGLL